MRRSKLFLFLMLICCFCIGAVTASAADDRLGMVVDGSRLTDSSYAEGDLQSVTRGTYLGYGSGRLSINGPGSVHVSGYTSCNRVSDQVKVTLHLQYLKNGSWATLHTLGPKVVHNGSYASNSRDYIVPGGKYYRVYGTHIAIKGDVVESVASYTDGFWVD